MRTSSRTVQSDKSSQHPASPAFFSDRGVANQLLSSIAILPEQFYTAPAGLDAARGEIALMRAVLEDAVGCFQKQLVNSGRRVQRLAREAEEWFFTDDHRWPFSFVNICAVLGLDPEYIRLGLKRWRQLPPRELQKKRRRIVEGQRSLKIAA
jgi:hypothetical protein